MKRILYILIALILPFAASSQSIGGKNNTIQVLGAMRVDTAFHPPLLSNGAFTSPNISTAWNLFYSTTDTLPRTRKRGADLKILTQFDSVTYYVAPSEKGSANGVATLNSSGKVPSSQISSTAVSEVFVDANQAAMLAHSGASVGAISVRTDSSISFILQALPSSTYSNWVNFTFGGVLTFNGRGGVVVPNSNDYITDSVDEGSTNLYYTSARVQSVIFLDTVSILGTQPYVNSRIASAAGNYVAKSDSSTGYVTPTRLKDTALVVVKYRDSVTKYVTPKNLKDTAAAVRAAIPTNTNQLTNGAGFITGNQSITISGEVTGVGTTAIAAKLNRINTNVGTFGNTTNVPSITIDSTGRISAATTSAIAFPATDSAKFVTVSRLRDSLAKFVRLADSATKYTTIKRLADTASVLRAEIRAATTNRDTVSGTGSQIYELRAANLLSCIGVTPADTVTITVGTTLNGTQLSTAVVCPAAVTTTIVINRELNRTSATTVYLDGAGNADLVKYDIYLIR